MTKTFSAKTGEFVRRWYVVDAQDEVLGRLATRVATVLRGKHKPIFTPHVDTGDFVIVVNAEKVKLTGRKLDSKMYRRHSEYPGGLKQIPYRRLLETHPERAIERAVKGMLPHTSLGRSQMRKLKVYKGADHPHTSQKPEPLAVGGQIPVVVERVPVREKVRREAAPAKASAPVTEKPSGRKAKAKPARKSPVRKKATARKAKAAPKKKKKKES